MTLAEQLQALVERHCRFNCDAESSCKCGSHEMYRALLAARPEPTQEQENHRLRDVLQWVEANCPERCGQQITQAFDSLGSAPTPSAWQPLEAQKALAAMNEWLSNSDGLMIEDVIEWRDQLAKAFPPPADADKEP